MVHFKVRWSGWVGFIFSILINATIYFVAKSPSAFSELIVLLSMCWYYFWTGRDLDSQEFVNVRQILKILGTSKISDYFNGKIIAEIYGRYNLIISSIFAPTFYYSMLGIVQFIKGKEGYSWISIIAALVLVVFVIHMHINTLRNSNKSDDE